MKLILILLLLIVSGFLIWLIPSFEVDYGYVLDYNDVNGFYEPASFGE